MKFIHIADVHLGAIPDAGKPWSKAREKEIWNAFENVIHTANQERVDLLLIAGDLFHRQPLLRELKEVDYLFTTLAHTRVVLIAGNHDYLKPTSFYHTFKWNDNVFFLKEKQLQSIYFEDINTEVYGLSYHSREIPDPLYDNAASGSTDRINILLAHGGDPGHIPVNNRKLANSQFDYIALGHIHMGHIVYPDKMAFAGALEPMDVNDTGVHGYIKGIYQQNHMSIEFVPAAIRSYIHLEIKSNSQMTGLQLEREIKSRINEQGNNNIYKIIIIGFRDPEMIYEFVGLESIGNIVELLDLTEPAFNFEKLKKQYQSSLIGKYIEEFTNREMDYTEQKALYYGVDALLKSKKN